MSVMRAPAEGRDPGANHTRVVTASLGVTQRSATLARLLGQYGRPVLVALGDAGRNVLCPIGLHGGVVVEVELAVDDAPMFGIALGGVALRDGPSAVSAVLGSEGLWVCLERGPVLRRGEAPAGAIPGYGVLRSSLHRLPGLEISDRIIAVDRQLGGEVRKHRRLFRLCASRAGNKQS